MSTVWKRLALASSLTLFFAALLWTYWPEERLQSLIFPQHIGEFEVEGSLIYQERNLRGFEKSASWEWTGVVRFYPGKRKAPGYRCEWRRLEISSEGKTIIGFEMNEEGSRYWTSPYFSEEKRAAIYAAFEVDISHNDANNDFSLFQLPIRVTLTSEGSIRELRLPQPIRRKLSTLLRRIKGAPLLFDHLEGRRPFPALYGARPKGWELITEFGDGEVQQIRARFFREANRRLLGSEEGYLCDFKLLLYNKSL